MNAPSRLQVSNIAAQLRTTDLAASLAFYARIGFDVAFQHEDFYAGIRAGNQLFHLKLVDERDPSIEMVTRDEHFHLYFDVDDIESAARRIDAAGVPMEQELHDTAWGTREFVIRDDQGHTLYFGTRIA
jgi:catechol 2,3-dioxygenase-like lactoylglutathione lyase family enzyme